MNTLPTTMAALELESYQGWRTGLKLVNKPVPRPGPGELLVKVAASPVNPADFAFMKGQYGVRKPLPTVPGLEASGTVVATGGGVAARFFMGRRVACIALNNRDGAWAEYMLASPYRCIPLRKHVTNEQGATLIINPLTAWGLVDLARRGGHRAVVQTAAAGALGRMLLRLGQRAGLTMVNIVRRDEQVDLLHSLGATHVLGSHRPDFDEQLRETCRRLGVSLALDAVAGEMTDRLLAALPRRGQVIVYGALSNAACQVNPGRLIFKQQQVRGFWLTTWRPRLGLLGQLYAGWQVQNLLANELSTQVQARLPLSEAARGLEMYVKGMSKGKILLVPSM